MQLQHGTPATERGVGMSEKDWMKVYETQTKALEAAHARIAELEANYECALKTAKEEAIKKYKAMRQTYGDDAVDALEEAIDQIAAERDALQKQVMELEARAKGLAERAAENFKIATNHIMERGALQKRVGECGE